MSTGFLQSNRGNTANMLSTHTWCILFQVLVDIIVSHRKSYEWTTEILFLNIKKYSKQNNKGTFLHWNLDNSNSLNWNSQIPWTYTRVPWRSYASVQRKPWFEPMNEHDSHLSRFTLVSHANYRRKQMMCCGVPPNEIPFHCMLKRTLRKNLHQCFWILPNTLIAVQIIVKCHHVGFLNQSGKAEMTKCQI